MGQSLVSNYLHITFSTKDRQPLITDAVEDRLYNYLGGICSSLDCQPIIVGGYTDHIHILCQLSKKLALIKLMEDVKSHSSKWIKGLGDEFASFYWQNGYGAFSVNPSETDKVVQYILHQKEHHQKMSFQDEFRAFLEKYKVVYDERYVWD